MKSTKCRLQCLDLIQLPTNIRTFLTAPGLSLSIFSFRTSTISSDWGAAAVERQAAGDFRIARDDENCRHKDSMIDISFFGWDEKKGLSGTPCDLMYDV